MHLVEQIGSGIARINDSMKQAKLSLPTFKTQGMFTFIFERNKVNNINNLNPDMSEKMSGKNVREIMDLIFTKPSITIPEMATKLNLTERTIYRQLNQMKKSKLVERIGPAKGGHWKVIED